MKALRGEGITICGMTDDLTPLYEFARVFVAPHRYAAGIPNKVLEASAHGMPCVISPVLSSQLEWTNGVEVLTACSADEFVGAIHKVYEDGTLWQRLRDASLRRLEEQFSVGRFQAALSSAIQASGAGIKR
jgi:glycosyltransferase involved in cell wall biosynthesis